MHVGSNSPTRDRTRAPCIGNLGVLATGPPGKSAAVLFHLACNCARRHSCCDLTRNAVQGEGQLSPWPRDISQLAQGTGPYDALHTVGPGVVCAVHSSSAAREPATLSNSGWEPLRVWPQTPLPNGLPSLPNSGSVSSVQTHRTEFYSEDSAVFISDSSLAPSGDAPA